MTRSYARIRLRLNVTNYIYVTCCICVVLLTLIFSQNTGAQVMVSPTGKPSSLEICGDDGTFTLLIANTTGGTMSGATLLVDLPPGCRYTPGTVTGATEFNITNLNQPLFSLPDILNNTAHNVSYDAGLTCGYNNTANFIYTVTYNSSVYTGFETPLQNYYYPEPVITNITNSSATIPVNTSVTRDITIAQQGLNSSLDTLILLDEHTSDIQLLSVSLGTLHPYVGPGPIIVDTIIITGADFPGGNGMFDQGEQIVVSETVKLVGCTNGQSTLKAAWGCFGQYCSYYSAFPTVSPSSGNTVIAMAFTNNNRDWGFIDNSGWVEFTVSNNGTGAGTAFNLVILSGFSSGGSTYYPNSNWINKIDSFSVNGNYVTAGYSWAAGATNGQYSFYTTFPYVIDPDGAGTGLDDMDGDGYYDDLPPGKSVVIKAHTFYSWTQALSTIPTGNSCGAGWTNSAYQAFRYGYLYENQCDISSGVNWLPNGNLVQFQTYNTNTVQHTIPPDIYDGIPVWMEQTVNTGTVVSATGCPNDSVIYKLLLPDGIIIAPGTATFRGISMGAPLINGNTVIYYLSRSRILSGGIFRVPLQVDCEANHPATGYVHAELKFWCDKTNFPARFFTYWCSNSPTFGIQCPITNCPDPSVSTFDIKRTTLGWTNNQLTARISPSTPGLRRYNAMSKDTIRVEAGGRLHGPADSLYFSLQHGAIGGAWGNQLFFDVLTDTLYFTDFETGQTFSCSGLSPQITNGATSVLTTFFGALDLPGNCLEGISFTDGDSLRYVVFGKVKNVAVTEWRTVPLLRARFFQKSLGKDFFCNDRGSTFNVLGSNYPATTAIFYQQIVLQGCPTFLYEGNYYRSMETCGGEIAFPAEVRPFSVLDTMIFTLPEGFLYQAGSARHSYNTDGGSFPTEVIADPIIEVASGSTRLIFIRTSSWSYSDYYDCGDDRERITFYASPSCQATGNYNYSVYGSGRYQFMADGQGVRSSGSASKTVTYTPSLVNLTNLITTAEGRQDTVMWKVRLCNVRSFDSNNNWLGFENASAGITIVAVTDVTNPGTPLPLTVNGYGPGKRWAQIGTIAGSECRTYEVRAIYNNCAFDSIHVRHGYNCAGYPSNPEFGYPPSAYQCSENGSYLFLDPKDVSLNLNITAPVNPVSLCDTLTYEAEVTNSQLSYGYALKLTVAVPPGISIIPSMSEFKYPYSTGSYTLIGDPVNDPPSSNKWVYDLSADPGAIDKLKGVDSIPRNGYRLKFSVLADCNFISGTAMNLTASASNACGAIKSRSSYTPSILIGGLPSNVNLYVLSSQAPDVMPTCSESTLFKIKIINLGPDSVSTIEKLSISIDDGFDYVIGSLFNIHNGPSGIASNNSIGGIRYIYFQIQPNLAVNDSIVFTFQLHDIDPGSLECDTITVQTSTLIVAVVPCVTAPGGICSIHSITSTVTSNKVIVKDYLGFSSATATSVPNGGTGETVTVNYTIFNSGADTLQTNTASVIFLNDANGNGIPDDTGADSLFIQVLDVTGLLPGEGVAGTAVFDVPADKICNMIAALRLEDNPCICGDDVIPLSAIRLFNAGPDTTVCQNDTIGIGMPGTAGLSYTWIPSLYLSQQNISNPLFCNNTLLNQPDTLRYILVTTRTGGCMSRDTMFIIVYPVGDAFAGADSVVCEGSSYMLWDAFASNAQSVLWSTAGSGTFSDPTIEKPTYTPGSGDILSGSVQLTMTVQSIMNCGADSDDMTLSITRAPVITAGADTSICSSFTFTNTGSGGSFYSGLAWTTTGDGTFSNNLILHPVYTPGPADISAGSVSLVLTAQGLIACPSVSDTMVLYLAPPPLLTTSPLYDTICSEATTAINLLSNQAGTDFSWTAALTAGSVSGFSGGSGSLISQTLTNNDTTAGVVTYTITPANGGCIGTPESFAVTVLPLPAVTNNPPDTSFCSGGSTAITLQSTLNFTQFAWTAAGSSPEITGFSDGSGGYIGQVIQNSGQTTGAAIYTILPSKWGCTGPGFIYTANIYPLPSTVPLVVTPIICTGDTAVIALTSPVTGATFTWTASGSSPAISGFTPGSGDTISQILFNSGTVNGSVTYVITALASGCPGMPQSAQVVVRNAPAVIFTVCFDPVTTTGAQPIILKGGIPYGGNYAGQGVTSNIFDPSSAGPGTHILTYFFTNMYGCTGLASTAITVIPVPAFTCGDTLTDIRDNRIYPTIQIGTQCWLASNLNYGNMVSAPSEQRDNCVIEKFCFQNTLANCDLEGGLYQWDEVMNYLETPAVQGICPPGWHVPDENDWDALFAFYISSGFAGKPLLYTGYSGFNAHLSGTRFNNVNWNFHNFATLMWSSSMHGKRKAWSHGMNMHNYSVSFYPSHRNNAFSVRCLQD